MGSLMIKSMMNDRPLLVECTRGHTTSDETTTSISVIEPPVQLDTQAS